MELFGEESYRACNISDTRDEIPSTNILHAPHFGFSGPRLTDLNLLFVCFGATAPPLPPVGQDIFIHEVSRSHSTTHHSR